MAFLNKAELKTVATDEIINLITNNDDTIVEEIIEESIDIMSSYLHKYYDTESIFAQEDDARSKTIFKYLKGIVIHEIYIRRSKVMNEVAKERYDEAMLWLEKVTKGQIAPDLPLRQVDEDGDGNADGNVSFMKLGSGRNYKNRP